MGDCSADSDQNMYIPVYQQATQQKYDQRGTESPSGYYNKKARQCLIGEGIRPWGPAGAGTGGPSLFYFTTFPP